MLSRYGGDEFAVFMPEVNGENEASGVAQTMLDRISEPFFLSSQSVYITSAIGIRIASYGRDTCDSLLKDAGTALYMAKKQHNSYQIFTWTVSSVPSREATIEKLLPFAIGNHEFELYYHPKVELRDNTIFGLEALL